MKTRSKTKRRKRTTMKKRKYGGNKKLKKRAKKGGYNEGDGVTLKELFNYYMHKMTQIMQLVREMGKK
jgi:hypothetical protein